MSSRRAFRPVLGPVVPSESPEAGRQGSLPLARSVQNAVASFVSQVHATWAEVVAGMPWRGQVASDYNGADEYELRRQRLLELAQDYIGRLPAGPGSEASVVPGSEASVVPEPDPPAASCPVPEGVTLTPPSVPPRGETRHVACGPVVEAVPKSPPPRHAGPRPAGLDCRKDGAWAVARTGFQLADEDA